MDIARATALSKALARAGFLGLGGFHPQPEDGVPVCGTASRYRDAHPASAPGHRSGMKQSPLASPLPQGEGQGEGVKPDNPPTRTLLLIGSAGPALFQLFEKSPEAADGLSDPLDRYTARVLGQIAGDFGFGVAFPFEGPPWHPFQQWAMKAGGFSPSPMGVLAHETYGPWAGFRAAFLSPEVFGTFELNGQPGPCETCEDKPCLSACPAGALSAETGYDVPRCRDHLEHIPRNLNRISRQGYAQDIDPGANSDHESDPAFVESALGRNPQADCFSGCLARRACPFGREFLQSPGQARFHMAAFLKGVL